ncbi:MAG: OmpA family protein, partial [Acidobacteria bacterium]|nr:OmpA family protein [Acidobacteriota bacterium]
SARIDALEAKAAADAAQAKAAWVALARQGNDLRSEIAGFGGTAPAPIVFEEPAMAMMRGADSSERVAYARAVVAQAKAASGDGAAIQRAEELLGSAEGIAKSQKQSDTADYLAYSAEMLAREAFYEAQHREVEGMLPGLRMERTRFAQIASERQAAEERQRRTQAEQQAAELRAQLQAEQANRAREASEVEALRRQIAENETRLQRQFEQDRAARLEAEARLTNLAREYELALANRADVVESDRLRRQIEDQQIALRAVQDRETLSEQLMQQEIDRLRRELETQRVQGSAVNMRALDEQQARLDERARELSRFSAEREAAEKKRAADEAAFAERIRALESQAAASAEERASLQQQVEAERARAAQAEAELAKTRETLAQQEEQRQRLANMEKTLAEIAQTRRDERGFILTLPGIFFDTGKAELKSGSRTTIDRLAEQLRLNERITVVVEGHTDSTGSEEMNHALSHRRATAVKDALVAAGVPAERIQVVGKGETAPIATNNTAAGRQQNRRVEIVLGGM